VSRVKKYRRRAIIYASVTAAFLIAALFLYPRLKAYSVEKFQTWPMIAYLFILKIPGYIFGTLCVMSTVSALADITIKNKRPRITLLVLGIVLLAFYIYSLSPTIINVIPYPAGRFWLISYYIFMYPVLFAVPVCLVYLGAVKPAGKICETE
jgi:hypothetical protein